jgi:hypothetical protein
LYVPSIASRKKAWEGRQAGRAGESGGRKASPPRVEGRTLSMQKKLPLPHVWSVIMYE